MTKLQLQEKIRSLLGIQSVFESAKINSQLLQTILDEQRRLRLLVAEQFSQKSPISFYQMDAIMVETRDRLDIAVMSLCRIEGAIERLASAKGAEQPWR